MEILLPVALKLFPNMLPSTFEGQLAKVGFVVVFCSVWLQVGQGESLTPKSCCAGD